MSARISKLLRTQFFKKVAKEKDADVSSTIRQLITLYTEDKINLKDLSK